MVSFFFLQNCQYTASSFPSISGPGVKFKCLLLRGYFELRVRRGATHEAAFLFLWSSSTFIVQVRWYLIWGPSTAFYRCGKAGLSVNLCLGLQPPVFPRLVRAAGSFSDLNTSPAERKRAQAERECRRGDSMKKCEKDSEREKSVLDRREGSEYWLTEGRSIISFQKLFSILSVMQRSGWKQDESQRADFFFSPHDPLVFGTDSYLEDKPIIPLLSCFISMAVHISIHFYI